MATFPPWPGTDTALALKGGAAQDRHDSVAVCDDGRVIYVWTDGNTLKQSHYPTPADFYAANNAGATAGVTLTLDGVGFLIPKATVWRHPTTGELYLFTSIKTTVPDARNRVWKSPSGNGESTPGVPDWTLHGTIQTATSTLGADWHAATFGIGEPYVTGTGRWILPCTYLQHRDTFKSGVFTSDDEGATWTNRHIIGYYILGGIYGDGFGRNIVEVSGSFYFGAHGNVESAKVAVSSDNGTTWATTELSDGAVTADFPIDNDWPDGEASASVLMAPTFIDGKIASSDSPATSLTVAAPTHSDGDLLLLAAIQASPTSSTLGLPAGWTEDARLSVNSKVSAVFAHRVATSEPADYTMGFGAEAEAEAVHLMSWADHDGLIDVAFTSGFGTDPPPVTAVGSAGPVATAASGKIVGAFLTVGRGSAITAIPSGWTAHGSVGSTGGTTPMCGTNTGSLASDGTSMGPYDFDVEGFWEIQGWMAGLWALYPAGGAAATKYRFRYPPGGPGAIQSGSDFLSASGWTDVLTLNLGTWGFTPSQAILQRLNETNDAFMWNGRLLSSVYTAPCVPPANDDWTNAETISGDIGLAIGTTVCASLEPSEPDILVGDSTNTVWYVFIPSVQGVIQFLIDGDGLRMNMEVYTGSDLATLYGPISSYSGDDPLFPMTVYATDEAQDEGGIQPYWIRVSNDVIGESGPFNLSWILTPSPTAYYFDRNTPIVFPNTLGCSQHVAYVQSKCNGPRLCELSGIRTLTYDRRLDDVSEAFIELAISGDMENPCCQCLGDIEPWCHQLTIVREGDGVVWTGPIQKIIYGYETVKIEAKDKLAWLQVRINEDDLEFNMTDNTVPLTTIAATIAEVAMADDGDSPCFLDCVQDLGDGLPIDEPRQRVFSAFEGPTAFDDFQAMADSGIDYTVINHCLILTGEDLPQRSIGTLRDEHILGEIEVSKDGNQQGNRYFVRYDGDEDCENVCTPQASEFCPCPAVSDEVDHECYGSIERIISGDLGLQNVEDAEQTANAYVRAAKIAPRRIEFPSGTRLSPNTPWQINDMIPGQRVDVALSKLCFPVFESFKLQTVTVEDSSDGEIIGIDLVALNVTTVT